MIVVDTNVVANLYLPTSHGAAAESLLSRHPDWHVPRLWRSEFRNFLSGYLRRGALTFEQACRIQEEAEGLLEGSEYEVESRTVMKLVRDSDCSAYDCEFVALALQFGTKLVTLDRKLLKAFPKDTVMLG